MESLKERDLVKEAKEIGSKAVTVKGAVRALINHYKALRDPSKTIRSLRYLRKGFQDHIDRRTMDDFRKINTYSSSHHAFCEKRRKADSEAKAARNGYKRKSYLAKLRRTELRALKVDMSSFDSISKAHDTKYERNKELKEVARLRSIVTGKEKPPLTFKMPDNVCLVPARFDAADQVGFKPVRRGMNAQVRPTFSKSWYEHIEGYTTWHNGKPKSYRRAENNTYLRSFAVIVDDRTLEGICHNTIYIDTLPDGYKWAIDYHGLKICKVDSPIDDYHPNAHELMNNGSCSEVLIERVEENRQKRFFSLIKSTDRAELEGVFVCLADSLRAGNCRQGTLSFSGRHGLDEKSHYSANYLLDVSKGDVSKGDVGRVRLAVMAATIRHKRELDNGVCLLKDHKA